MTRLVPISIAVALSACAADTATAPAIDQAGLDAMLAGRTAQEPQTCVNMRLLGTSRTFGEGAILFGNRSQGTVYLNRPLGGCPELNSFRALRTTTTATQLCRGDIAVVFDPTTGVEYGGCALGDFVPYKE